MTNWAGTAADLQKLYESLNERHSRLYADHEALAARLAELIAAADAVVYRPAVDDSRKIDSDLRNLREVTNRLRAADRAEPREVVP